MGGFRFCICNPICLYQYLVFFLIKRFRLLYKLLNWRNVTMVVFKEKITNDPFQLLFSLEAEGHLCVRVREGKETDWLENTFLVCLL